MDRNQALLVGLVVSLHLTFFFLDFGSVPSCPRLNKKPIVVRTLTPPPSFRPTLSTTSSKAICAPLSKKSHQKKGEQHLLPTEKKSQAKKRTPSLETVQAKRRALKKVEQSLNAINTPLHLEQTKEQLPLPLKVSHLEIDRKEGGQPRGYLNLLTRSLKEALALPERGNVKLALTIQNTGKVLKLQVLESDSHANQAYLESHLLQLSLPPFGKGLNDQNEQTWVVTFCNEN